MFFDLPLAKGKILSETPHYHGPIFDVVTQKINTPDGLTVERDLIRHPNAVAMLALTDDGRVLVNREYRVATNSEVFGLPAGLIDPGEDWQTAASRELHEETGYLTHDLQWLTAVRSSEGMTDETVNLVLAKINLAAKTSQDFDKDEFVTSRLVPFSELVAGVKAGKINSAQTVAAVTYYLAFIAKS
ncbi:NUDIX hydrolase [Lacticaseibacillus chiayiensis]|uniref:NUDIX hydrolase n=1 Tax=Lacticaseibacillus chiayiensis TaxID=2100821 RepID=A0ABY6H8P5_9LACO|nr:NUDIX hydrolase [Lacticaseibacillus chiayiensis]QVI35893.1 NUDIX hydrolase [Lacticaseibacillus chiayiensis]UYN57737.1 NUDIX hydrolase [Lacticaseibacillus chiayiensis]